MSAEVVASTLAAVAVSTDMPTAVDAVPPPDSVLKALALSGGDWVIHLLILGSILTLAVIIERIILWRRERRAFALFQTDVARFLERGDWREALRVLPPATDSAAASVVAAALRRAEEGPDAVEEVLGAARIPAKYRLERRLWVLGTLGNNAPFIGLFGTVLGVIKAFADLSASAGAGPEVVMAGLSEALIATAVGLIVAIPAVMANNYFAKRAGELLAQADALGLLLLAALKRRDKS